MFDLRHLTDAWRSAFTCLCIFGSFILGALLDLLNHTWWHIFRCASTRSQRNEFWWNSLSYRGLWKVPEDLVCMDLCTSDLSGISHAGLRLHRGCPSTCVPLHLALSGCSGLFKRQPQSSVCSWFPAWAVLYSTLEPQQCCSSWRWTPYWELSGRLELQHRNLSKHHSYSG